MNSVRTKELEKARDECAKVIAQFGARYLPIFERLENEIINRQKEKDLLSKALRIASQNVPQIATQFATHSQNHNNITL